MNTSHRFPAALLLPLLAALLAMPAEARVRHTTVTGPNGQAATRNVQRQQGDVQSTSTGPRGQTRSRNVQRSAQGTQATVTGAKGQTMTRDTTHTGTGSTTTVTGPNGQSGTVTVERSH